MSNELENLFDLATIEDVCQAFKPETVEIMNNDYRGCPPVDVDMLHKFYDGTDVLSTGVKRIEIEGRAFKIWL